MIESNDFVALIPAFNEQETIGHVVAGLRSQNIEVVVIDDASTDLTNEIAKNHGADVLILDRNHGVAGALQQGFRYVRDRKFSYLLQCDGDGQHPPDFALGLLKASEIGEIDLNIGDRYSARDNLLIPNFARRVVIRVLRILVKKKTGASVSDVTSGYRVFSRRLVLQFAENFPDYYLGDTVEALVVALDSGYSVAETPIPMNERKAGQASIVAFSAFRATVRAIVRISFGRSFQITKANALQVQARGRDLVEP